MPKTGKPSKNHTPNPPYSEGRPKRTRVKTKPFLESAKEEDFEAIGEEEDIQMEFDEPDDSTAADNDWLLPEKGRPAPFSTTWSMTYSPLKVVKDEGGSKKTTFTIPCGEKGCGKPIVMYGAYHETKDSKGQSKSLTNVEMNQKSKKADVQTRPPVCHGISWAALKRALKEFEQGDIQGKKLSDSFKRSVCWYQKNLHPGHNGCNAAGAKTTEANASTNELKMAHAQVQTVSTVFTKNKESIWDL